MACLLLLLAAAAGVSLAQSDDGMIGLRPLPDLWVEEGSEGRSNVGGRLLPALEAKPELSAAAMAEAEAARIAALAVGAGSATLSTTGRA